MKPSRDWSLNTGRWGGGYKTGGGGGQVKFYHAEGGDTKSFGLVFTL